MAESQTEKPVLEFLYLFGKPLAATLKVYRRSTSRSFLKIDLFALIKRPHV